MYILYLDASGDPGEYRGRNTKFYALVGLVCKPEITHECAKKLDDILKSCFPSWTIPRPKKLHYYDLIHNKYPYNKIDRKALADEIFDLIVSSEITLFSMVIDKVAHWNQYAHPIPPHNLALEMMMGRYEWFLERNKDLGLVVSDEESLSLMKSLLELFERFKKRGTAFKELKNVIDTIFFTPSETSAPLQLTDFCAYAIFSKFEHGKDDRFKQIEPKLYPLYGLRVFP